MTCLAAMKSSKQFVWNQYQLNPGGMLSKSYLLLKGCGLMPRFAEFVSSSNVDRRDHHTEMFGNSKVRRDIFG